MEFITSSSKRRSEELESHHLQHRRSHLRSTSSGPTSHRNVGECQHDLIEKGKSVLLKKRANKQLCQFEMKVLEEKQWRPDRPELDGRPIRQQMLNDMNMKFQDMPYSGVGVRSALQPQVMDNNIDE